MSHNLGMLGINDSSVLDVVPANVTQQQSGLPGGMGPKKGIKKLTKDERVAILRAKWLRTVYIQCDTRFETFFHWTGGQINF